VKELWRASALLLSAPYVGLHSVFTVSYYRPCIISSYIYPYKIMCSVPDAGLQRSNFPAVFLRKSTHSSVIVAYTYTTADNYWVEVSEVFVGIYRPSTAAGSSD
jgi:hypothetical protein